MTIGNSSPLALCADIIRTPCTPSSRSGASADLPALRLSFQMLDEASKGDEPLTLGAASADP